ncbi:MAG: ABC transporter substrate-binding protein [Mycobacterium sp.]
MKPQVGWKRAAVALVALTLVACSSSESGSDASGSSSEPRPGGEITVLTNNFATGWVSSKSASNLYEAQVWGQIADKFVYTDNDGKVFPWLAESWDVSPDGAEYVLHLRPGVTFSDGTPFDAETAVANLNIWSKGDPDRGIARVSLFPNSFKSADAIDAQTVKVTLSRPDLGFIPTLGYHGAVVLSKKTLALSVDEQGDLSNVVGSGPFVVKSWAPNQEVVLEKRPDYDWPAANAQHQGPAYLDSITFRVVPDDLQRGTSVESDQAHIAQNVPPEELAAAKAEGFVVETPRFFGAAHGLQLRLSAKHLDDVKVRQAIQHAINRNEILKTVYTEDWLPATTIFNGNVPEAVDLSDHFAFDKDRAEQLLDEAGWTEVGADGIRVKNGERLSFFAVPSPFVSTSKLEWEVIAQQFKAVGIEVTLRNADVSAYAKYGTDDTLPFYEAHNSLVDAGASSYAQWSSKGANQFRANDPKLDALLTGFNLEQDPAKRKALAAEVQEYILDQAYFVPLEQISQGTYLQSPKVKGVVFNVVARPWYYDTWLDQSA